MLSQVVVKGRLRLLVQLRLVLQGLESHAVDTKSMTTVLLQVPWCHPRVQLLVLLHAGSNTLLSSQQSVIVKQRLTFNIDSAVTVWSEG